MLWPDGIRRNIKTGPDREVVAVYPRRSDCPKSVWRSLISGADRDITFAGYTDYFLWLELPNLRPALRRKAESGCQVRFLVGDPDSETTRRREDVHIRPERHTLTPDDRPASTKVAQGVRVIGAEKPIAIGATVLRVRRPTFSD